MKNNKTDRVNEVIAKLEKSDKDKFHFVGAKLKCPSCKKQFGIDKEYIGVVTCPYCGEYVEG